MTHIGSVQSFIIPGDCMGEKNNSLIVDENTHKLGTARALNVFFKLIVFQCECVMHRCAISVYAS